MTSFRASERDIAIIKVCDELHFKIDEGAWELRQLLFSLSLPYMIPFSDEIDGFQLVFPHKRKTFCSPHNSHSPDSIVKSNSKFPN